MTTLLGERRLLARIVDPFASRTSVRAPLAVAVASVLCLAPALDAAAAAGRASNDADDLLEQALENAIPTHGWAHDPAAELFAQASMVNPAQTQRDAQATTGTPASESSGRIGSWERPAIVVEGRRISPLREEDLIGPNQQPRWTARRRFVGTRIYVAPSGQIEGEQWFRWKNNREGQNELVTQSEVSIGMPHRLQLDLYLITRKKSDEERKVDQAIELRYALADWGRIWGNPTLYFEYISQEQDPDKAEVKLLLGDEITSGWHWGTNFVWEGETGGEREHELEWTAAISNTVIDEKFSWGLESKMSWADVKGDRGNYEEDFRVGPSFQYRPMPQMHIDFAPLFGVTSESKHSDIYLILGYEF